MCYTIIMSWQVAFIISVVLAIGRLLYTRRYAQRSTVPGTIPPAVGYLFGVLPVGLIAGLLLFPHEIHWSSTMIVVMIVLSASMALANWWGFLVAGRLAIAPQQTIGTITNVAVVIMGWTLLGETLTTAQFVGGGILLVAALLAIWSPVKSSKTAARRIDGKTVALAIGAALMLAIGLVSEKALLEHMDIGGIFLVSWPIQLIGMLLLASKDISRKALRAFKATELRDAVIIGVANGLNGLFYIYAIFHSDNISLITVLGTIIFPLTVLGAYIFLREREHHALMWLSVAISCVGLLVFATL